MVLIPEKRYIIESPKKHAYIDKTNKNDDGKNTSNSNNKDRNRKTSKLKEEWQQYILI